MLVVNNTTTYKDVNEILVKEGKEKVLQILQSADNPRFVTYYITHTLKDLTNLNLDSKIKDVLKVIRTENNPSYTDSYIHLISSITKLAVSDLKRTYESIRPVYGYDELATTKKKTKVVYPTVVNNMINSFRKLIQLLLVDPSLAEDSYDEIECKSPEKINIQEIQDYFYIIKSLATNDFAPKDLIDQENKLVNNLYKNKKISEGAYKFALSAIDEIQANQSYSISIRSNKTKCVALVGHINACYDEIMVSQIKYDIGQGRYKDQELEDAKAELQRLNNKIKNYKAHKKTKYHIA
ncbi:MAG: hypothetical protein MJ200_01830 [Mycoplasmoidaceae bacterium]|nr:hypothetical protein [Mycoplasmoidaceae bacterium]